MAEGVELIRCALESGAPVESVYVSPEGGSDGPTQEVCRRATAAGARVFPLAAGVLERVADTVTPQPVLAVVPMLAEPGADVLAARPGSLVMVLVDVRDPGNAGTVLRAADASGATAVLFAADSVDPYNPKTVRASAGSLFHIPFAVRDDPRAVAEELSEAGFRTLATVVRHGDDYTDFDWSVPTRGLPRQRVLGPRRRTLPDARRSAGHPDGRPGGIAERRRGQRGGRLRGGAPAPGRGCRGT